MLALLNNFVAPNNRIVLDCQCKKSYLLIEKCGTQSLLDLTIRFPNQFRQLTLEEFLQTDIDTLTVFIREPIGRYISGIKTQINLYQIPEKVFKRLLNADDGGMFPMFDSHTMPQFWFLLRFGVDSTIKFKFVELSNIQQVHKDIKNLNVNSPRQFDFLNDKSLTKIDYAMTEDIVLYTQFLGKTATVAEILSQIAKEENFFSEAKQYKHLVPYIN